MTWAKEATNKANLLVMQVLALPAVSLVLQSDYKTNPALYKTSCSIPTSLRVWETTRPFGVSNLASFAVLHLCKLDNKNIKMHL